jgi:hypothetical protein
MSQHDYVISDQDGASFLVDLLALCSAIVTQNAGDTEPSTTYPHMFWVDTSANKIKQRNEANDAWVEIGDLDSVGWGKLARSGGAMAGVLQLDKSSDIVAAATTDLGTATGNSVTVTHASGTLAITSFGAATDLQAGTVIDVTLSISGGTLTLTHNATSLYIPGGLNLTLADKDVLRLQKTSDSNAYWKVVGGVKADGTPLVSTSASIIGSSKNLVITNNSATPNSQVDIDADEIILKNASGIAYLASSVNLTANIAASGANGLDTGAEVGGTWYYLWVIYNGSAVASLISTSSTAPTMPSGYTYKALVGAIYNDVSGNFIKYRQVDKEFFISEVVLTSTVPTTGYVSVSLSTAVPPIARIAKINASWNFGASATTTLFNSPNNGDDLSYNFRAENGGGTACRAAADFNLPMITAQTMYYKRSGTAPTAGALYCNGGKY